MNNYSMLDNLTQQAPNHVVQAIKSASAKTGVDFSYMLQQAKAESSFNTSAEAKTSSATGLYQFIESTWMNMVKNHGHKYGLKNYADQIDLRGKVSDPQMRQEILDLRKDAELSSLLAGELASENQRFLQTHVGGDIGSTELYFAHFLGASGATGFLNAMKNDPYSVGANLFPREAAANKGVFYDGQTGQPRTLKQIYDFFDRKFEIKNGPGLQNRTVTADTNTLKATEEPPVLNYVQISPSMQKPIRYVQGMDRMDAVQVLLNFPTNAQTIAARDINYEAPVREQRFAASLYARQVIDSFDILSLYKTTA